jgi:hypothetical protein
VKQILDPCVRYLAIFGEVKMGKAFASLKFLNNLPQGFIITTMNAYPDFCTGFDPEISGSKVQFLPAQQIPAGRPDQNLDRISG